MAPCFCAVLCYAVICTAPRCADTIDPTPDRPVQAVQHNPASASDFSATPLPPSLLPSLPRLFPLLGFLWMVPLLPYLPTQKIGAPPTPGSLSPPDFSPLSPVRPSKYSTPPSLLSPSSYFPLHHQLDSFRQSSRTTSPVSSDPYKLLEEAI